MQELSTGLSGVVDNDFTNTPTERLRLSTCLSGNVDSDFLRQGVSQAVDRPLWLSTVLGFWANSGQIRDMF